MFGVEGFTDTSAPTSLTRGRGLGIFWAMVSSVFSAVVFVILRSLKSRVDGHVIAFWL